MPSDFASKCEKLSKERNFRTFFDVTRGEAGKMMAKFLKNGRTS